jgi:hypothetical protein
VVGAHHAERAPKFTGIDRALGREEGGEAGEEDSELGGEGLGAGGADEAGAGADKELVAEGVRRVLEQPIVDAMQGADTPEPLAVPRWFGSLQAYAQNAAGNHDLDSMRRSVARGRTRQPE